MANFEDNIKSKTLTSGKNDPAATDLDYYSKPENYTGSNLQSLQRFKQDKTKEDNAKKTQEKKKVVKDARYHFFHRYKHLLQDAIFIEDLLEREQEIESEDDEDGDEDAQGEDLREGAKTGTDPLHTITEEGAVVSSENKTRTLEADERKSRGSLRSADMSSPDKSISTIPSGIYEDRTGSPDSGGFVTPGGSRKKMPMISPSGRQSTAIQRAQMDKMSRDIRAKQLRAKFAKAIRGVKAINRLANSARGKQAGGDMSSMRTFMDIANEETSTEENMKNAGLSFDPNYFKAKKEISLSTDTKMILTTPSEDRTPEQVQTAMFGLQSLRSYAEYPLHMQEKLAKVAWYEIVAPKRIIIRQGHFAENFYFILSGNAVVTILLKDPKTGASFVKTATVMKKGMSFGELALLHHSKRTATVTSQDTVQLLSIGREDFFDIFMASEGPDNMPEHIRFVSNLDFMKDWPLQELIDHPEQCLLHFFKRNTTIVANSNQSEWMYIIKSGSCQVLKKLKGVTAKSSYTKPKVDDNLFAFPKMKAIVFAPKVDSGLRKRKQSEEQNDGKPTEGDSAKVGDCDEQTKVRFSKERYSRQPETKKAHFSCKSSFAKRKHYEPPRRCQPKKTEKPVEPSASVKPGPVFVQVSTMKPRDVFGLECIQFDDDIERSHTAVSLISRGAELIMLSKEFFVKHANEAVKKRIRESVRPFPDEEVFQDNLQIKEDWTMYRKVLLTDLTSQIKEHSNRFNS